MWWAFADDAMEATDTQDPKRREISIIIPTLNEVDNIAALVNRLHKSLQNFTYELIFIDDHSSDGTFEKIQELQSQNRASVYLKQGKAGKAFSLIEGFAKAQYEYVAMIDADLQYPPEAIPKMLEVIEQGGADVVVANRKPIKESWFRRVLSGGFRYVFGKLLWKLDVDVQSGLKVFKQELSACLPLNPRYPWAFDLDFLLCALNGGYKIDSYDIDFEERVYGRTKVQFLATIKQLSMQSINLRLHPPYFIPFNEITKQKKGNGLYFRGQQYVTHTTLNHRDMAVVRTTLWQRIFLLLAVILLVGALVADWKTSLVVLLTTITVLYFCDLLFNLYLIVRSFYKNVEITVSEEAIAGRKDWPRYTIFCPLYKEAAVIPQFAAAMTSIEYPQDKLEILFLLEEDDAETQEAILSMDLPDYFRTVIVPHGLPKTKPKACNYGLLTATGEYAVIYDAEDIPDTLQLKKAVIAFEQSKSNIGCVQAKLNYYNSEQNILTRLFTLEYSLWFNLVLTGLHSVHTIIPLGGTSNHFRVNDLRSFEGWDPFNVTEDADLGMRLAKRGMRTVILDSFTLEEANSQMKNWFKQRSRWIKGYMQTYLVHMREPWKMLRRQKSQLLAMQLVVGGKVLSMLINPLLWIMTSIYLFIPGARDFIQSLYLTPILYLGIISLVLGNFLYMYYYMLGAAKHGRSELVLYGLLVPFYWVMMSIAAFYALRELIVRPHHWQKTKHGLHLKTTAIEHKTLPEAV